MARARKQESLPGPEFQRKEMPEIEDAAEELRALTGEKSTLNEKIRTARGKLQQSLTEAGLGIHRYPDADGIQRKAWIKSTPRACVERDKGATSEDDDDKSDGGADVE